MTDAAADPAIAVPVVSQADDSATQRKRPLTTKGDEAGEAPAGDQKRVKVGEEPAGPEAVKKQIEYYFSDDNMKYDRFFHGKISANPEGWLAMEHILSCKKIQNMKVSQDDIITAVKDTPLEVKVDDDGSAFVRRTTPLPPLQERPKREGGGGGKGGGKPNAKMDGKGGIQKQNFKVKCAPRSVSEIHSLGCLLRVVDVPEEVSWTAIKEALVKELPAESGGVRFVSTLTNKGEVFVYLRKFSSDTEFVKTKLSTLTVNGSAVKVELISDLESAQSVCALLPKPLQRGREKDMDKFKESQRNRPITLAETPFENINHLRQCLKELLSAAELDVDLKPQAFKVVRALLDYHPRGLDKVRDLVSIQVRGWDGVDKGSPKADTPGGAKASKGPTRCFFIKKADGTLEDFSVLKCVDELSHNPPFTTSPLATNAAAAETGATPTVGGQTEGAEANTSKEAEGAQDASPTKGVVGGTGGSGDAATPL